MAVGCDQPAAARDRRATAGPDHPDRAAHVRRPAAERRPGQPRRTGGTRRPRRAGWPGVPALPADAGGRRADPGHRGRSAGQSRLRRGTGGARPARRRAGGPRRRRYRAGAGEADAAGSVATGRCRGTRGARRRRRGGTRAVADLCQRVRPDTVRTAAGGPGRRRTGGPHRSGARRHRPPRGAGGLPGRGAQRRVRRLRAGRRRARRAGPVARGDAGDRTGPVQRGTRVGHAVRRRARPDRAPGVHHPVRAVRHGTAGRVLPRHGTARRDRVGQRQPLRRPDHRAGRLHRHLPARA